MLKAARTVMVGGGNSSRRQLWLLGTANQEQLIKKYRDQRVVGYSAEQMFDIVNDVEQYPQFVPWCKRAVLRRRHGERVSEYELSIGYPPLKEQYTSRVTTLYPYVIRAACTEGNMFEVFDTTWRFGPSPGGAMLYKNSCTVLFTLEFKFRSAFYASMSGMVFNFVANKMVCAFLARAQQLHGPPESVDAKSVLRRVDPRPAGASPLKLQTEGLQCDK